MSSVHENSPGQLLTIREYLSKKFQFIHLRLRKYYNIQSDTLDAQSIKAATQPLIEQFPLAIFLANMDGRFLYGNKKAEELSGYERSEIVGKRYYETSLVSLNDLMKIAALFASHAFNQDWKPYRFTLRRKQGTRTKVELQTHLINLGGTRILMSLVRELGGPLETKEGSEEEIELQQRILQLNKGMSPISMCMDCKKVQASEEEWLPIEYFLYHQLQLEFSHGFCPSCVEKRRKGEL